LIDKLARDPKRFCRRSQPFENGRAALQAFLRAARVPSDHFVALPAYVGWSVREGSGVFDPIQSLNLKCVFCRVDERLHMDLDHLRQLFRTHPVAVLILIHYFGHVDPGYAEAAALARTNGALLVEDEAHSMLTDLVGGIAGRLGDACIFSLHKLLPTPGGMLVWAAGRDPQQSGEEKDQAPIERPWEFDLAAIARRRRENALILRELLVPLAGKAYSLWETITPGEVPQTYPVVVRNGCRDWLYQAMNDAGFGVVSLYYRLVSIIEPAEFPVSHWLSNHILNLPVHQDVDPERLPAMISTLDRLLSVRSG
jgi:dTDP-4-amino-4,6-dideoxygalactose transaminase